MVRQHCTPPLSRSPKLARPWRPPSTLDGSPSTSTTSSRRWRAAASTWQYWHVYAEAQRQVRSAALATKDVARVVDLLVSEVLDTRSVSLARAPGSSLTDADGITEPHQLRRADGSSVYSSAQADLHTSRRILAAEQRLVAAAGRHDGHVVDSSAVDLAVLEQSAHGITLNPGQSTLVWEMATSGARLQLAIAPAGSGKTTAMRALARAWTDAGGTILGLAPSAAAAAALRSSIAPGSPNPLTHTDAHGAVHTETLAKLTHSLSHTHGQSDGPSGGPGNVQVDHSSAPNRTVSPMAEVPDWVASIGPQTLVVIDEAGMADTLSLDAVVTHVLERGGSVRLIGDDQQLAAIGAGGVLRDIGTHHGALHLSELVRFTNQAEAAASLALREGHPEALGFYLDHDRVHVGDLASVSDDVFAAWLSDRALGRDSIMLAPTRELVGELNGRARTARLDELNHRDSAGEVSASRAGTRSRSVRLGDGNEASVGDLIITRQNDRRLRTSTTDWVKNGDRWTVLHVHENGDLFAQHLRHHHTVRLPHDYVAAATGLGYACTIHTAQGVTADTMHGLATGEESRQQLYTMLTRGSAANHVYLQVVGDGDPHSVIHPSFTHPRTPAEILESILARDEAPHSATSLLREQTDPAPRLGLATQRYLDALHYAAEDVLRRQPAGTPTGVPTASAASEMRAGLVCNVVDALDHAAQRLAPGLSDEPAWPTLRARLLLLGANGHDPAALLTRAMAAGDLRTATDCAAVLDWRLDSALTGRDDVSPAPDAARPDKTLPDTTLPGPCRGCRESRPSSRKTHNGVATSPSVLSSSHPSQTRSAPAPPTTPETTRARTGHRTDSRPALRPSPTSRSGVRRCRFPPTTSDQSAHRSNRSRLRTTSEESPERSPGQALPHSRSGEVSSCHSRPRSRRTSSRQSSPNVLLPCPVPDCPRIDC